MRSWTARLLVAVLTLGASGPYAWAGASSAPPRAGLSGTILTGEPRQPVAGATLLAADSGSGRVYSSSPTGKDGRFSLRELPPSTYELAVQAGGGLYPTSSPIDLKGGQDQEILLALAEAGSDDPAAPELPGAKANVWSNPLTATLIVLGLAVVVGVALQSATDNKASASTP
jgi:hypothetical protein